MAVFCFVLKEREKHNQSQGLPDENVNQPVKTHRGSGKNNFKHMFRNCCVTGISFTCEILSTEKGQLKKTLPTINTEN